MDVEIDIVLCKRFRRQFSNASFFEGVGG